MTIDHTADWWLGDLNDLWFKALETAVREEWGVEPLRIREGGVRLPLCSAVCPLISPLVHPVRALPRKDVWLPRAAPPSRSELGARLGRGIVVVH